MEQLVNCGVDYISTTHFNLEVLATAVNSNLPVLCGVSNLEDSVNALKLGAKALKFYPATKISPSELSIIIKGLRDYLSGTSEFLESECYLPQSKLGLNGFDLPIFVAGGITESTKTSYLKAGATNFCVGYNCSSLMTFSTLSQIARTFRSPILTQ